MKPTKSQREALREKFGGRCAYCGNELQKGFHCDHIDPVYRGWDDKVLTGYNIQRGKNETENYNPACPRCNRWKSTWTIEQFRTEITKQTERLKRDSPQFRLALDFATVKETQTPVKFYFETFREQNPEYCLCDFVTIEKHPITKEPQCHSCKKPIKE